MWLALGLPTIGLPWCPHGSAGAGAGPLTAAVGVLLRLILRQVQRRQTAHGRGRLHLLSRA